MINKIRKQLFSNQDNKYLSFSSSLTKDKNQNRFIGVRSPILKSIIKELKDSNNSLIYLDSVISFINDNNFLYTEEIQIFGALVGIIKVPNEIRKKYLQYYLNLINSWENVDVVIPFHNFYIKEDAYFFPFLISLAKSNKEFVLRYMVLIMMRYYLKNKNHYLECKDILLAKYPDYYYLDMAIAWYIATYAAYDFNDAVNSFILNPKLKKWIFNKSISKCMDSYRINKEQKAQLKEIKQYKSTASE